MAVRWESREEEEEDNGNQRIQEKGESSENSFTIEKGVDLS
jgi:hypothetical protein